MSKSWKSRGDNAASESPTAWFAVLERARLTGDYELAAQARRELDRLGVAVKFNAKRSNQKGGSDAR